MQKKSILLAIGVIILIVLVAFLWFQFSKIKRQVVSSEEITSEGEVANEKMTSQRVEFITKDGVTIVANYFPNKDAKFAGILIHMRPATKESYNEFAEFLQKEGYAVLAIDLRGHGESLNSVSGKLNYNQFSEEEEKKSIYDLEAASLFLEKEGFTKDKQFLVGASIGANLSFQFLSENPEIKAIVLLSPGENYRGIALENFKKEGMGDKIFVVSSLDDPQSIPGSRKIKEWYPESKYIEYSFGGHGTNLFKTHPDLQTEILNWLREKLI